MWNSVDPMEAASLSAFRQAPEAFYQWFHPLALAIASATPNGAHLALAGLESLGAVCGVVTQNIDGLHQQAGSVRVCELHGLLRQACCMDCFGTVSAEQHLAAYVQTGAAPRCNACGGNLKPAVALFGEQLPYRAVAEAEALCDEADLFMIAGASLELAPASELPLRSLRQGARLVIVNREPTYLDASADVVIRDDVAEIFPLVLSEVLCDE